MSEEFLTVAEVAQRLKVNQQTVRNWIDRGQLTPTRVGERRVRVKLSDLEAYLGTTTSAPVVAIETAPVRSAASAPLAPGPPPVPDRAAVSSKLEAAQARKLHEVIDMLLDISGDVAPGSFLQRELAECAGRIQAALRVQGQAKTSSRA